MSTESLNVIALVSGGKDSFFSLLHCIHHGHRVVALANLFPAAQESQRTAIQVIDPEHGPFPGSDHATGDPGGEEPPTRDLNSHMYQTVGHELIPFYAAATGLPLYRQPIVGRAVHHERDYDSQRQQVDAGSGSPGEETECMMLLLRTIMDRHPEANALCSGAILSTYQRTRVESVASRLGLTPLAYLWKYTVLPPPLSSMKPSDEAQLLKDMAAAGLDARIVKVASAGLDHTHLWERVTDERGAELVKRALRRFGRCEGAALGEGGEFETVVLDGPAPLFKKRVCVRDEGRIVVDEGAGTAWLMLRGVSLEERRADVAPCLNIRTPGLLDSAFEAIQRKLLSEDGDAGASARVNTTPTSPYTAKLPLRYEVRSGCKNAQLCLLGKSARLAPRSIELVTLDVVDRVRRWLSSTSRDPTHITRVMIILRSMSHFSKVNVEYSKLFCKPNPPSRVTISCGDLLPPGCDIAAYFTASPPTSMAGERDGLHVQSRSYWAPANIGPYSQAISFPISSKGSDSSNSPREVSIAGQIPLIPALMELPSASPTNLQQQIVLSLQHLWRLGLEMKVKIWTSAVAYFARSKSAADMRRKAVLAGHAWKNAHEPRDDDQDAADEPDVWDRKFNPRFMSFEAEDHCQHQQSLPDWAVFSLEQQNDWARFVPPLFAAEVEELPRKAAVEWQAHVGLARMDASRAEIVSCYDLNLRGWKAVHVVVRGPDVDLIYTTVWAGLDEMTDEASLAYEASFGRVCGGRTADMAAVPYLVYLDKSKLSWQRTMADEDSCRTAVLPCHSLWSMSGERVGSVLLYRAVGCSQDNSDP